jgi:hypothetical protein
MLKNLSKPDSIKGVRFTSKISHRALNKVHMSLSLERHNVSFEIPIATTSRHNFINASVDSITASKIKGIKRFFPETSAGLSVNIPRNPLASA